MKHHNFKHGHTVPRSAEYRMWTNMMSRCYNPNYSGFKDYGGRGITVCDNWHSFEEFFAVIGKIPKGKTLGRKDNNGNYEPSNCEWQTKAKQARNRRSTKLTMALAREIRMLRSRGYTYNELAREFGVSRPTIGAIIRKENWKENAE